MKLLQCPVVIVTTSSQLPPKISLKKVEPRLKLRSLLNSLSVSQNGTFSNSYFPFLHRSSTKNPRNKVLRRVEVVSRGPKVLSLPQFHLKGKISFSIHPCLILQANTQLHLHTKAPQPYPSSTTCPSLYFLISGYFDHKQLYS